MDNNSEREENMDICEKLNPMLGAVIGDTVGSAYEWHNVKRKDFPLFSKWSTPTDDSIMTMAVGDAILLWDSEGRPGMERLQELAARKMRSWGGLYPFAGYGGHFDEWLSKPEMGPYNSWGNGSAMRTSAVAMAARSEEECREMARAIASVTHNHPEGIKGAESVSLLIYRLLNGGKKEDAREWVKEFYDIGFTLDEIRPGYTFDVSCQGSVPQAIEAFLEEESYENVIRAAVSVGGDSDTIAAIAGSIAAAVHPVPLCLEDAVEERLDGYQENLIRRFWERFGSSPEDSLDS